MKTPQGSVTKRKGRWVARITWTDRETGKRRERSGHVPSKNAGLDRVNVWRRQWQETGTIPPAESIEAEIEGRKTFAALAKYYRENYAVPAVIKKGKKVKGQKSWKTTIGHVKHLEAAFGKDSLESITWARIDELRTSMLAGKTQKGDERSVGYVNRVLSTLRRMFRVARQLEWTERNPFASGDVLIERAHEVERTRIVSAEEEAAILRHCTAENRRLHLRAIVITAIETGMREAEILNLRLDDVDWSTNTIHVRSVHTKTEESRDVPMTARLREELVAWLQVFTVRDRLFGIKNTLRHSWDTVRRLAAKDCPSILAEDGESFDLHFHDLRHKAATRMILAGIDQAIVGRVLGHKVAQTTRRYINVSKTVAAGVAKRMDRVRVRPAKRKEAAAVVAVN